jgi:putative ABC transport system substrate-binding protein
MVPNTAALALLVNLRNPESEHVPSDAQRAASTVGRQLLVLNASAPSEIGAAFGKLREAHAGALFVSGDAFFTGRRQQILALATRDAIPVMYVNREYVADGGLMSYGNDVADAYRRTGLVAARVLKGERPADLPVEQATKFEFVINRKTAKTLGLEVPPKLLFTADEVIE